VRVCMSAGGHLLFANPADGGLGFSSARMQGAIHQGSVFASESSINSAIARADCSVRVGTIKKSLDMGKTWTRELHVTPLGLTPQEGGSYDYSW
jgi:hypothetical protein